MLRGNDYVDYFALIKNIKHYKPHRKFLMHVVCYTDSQLINKKMYYCNPNPIF